MGAGDPQLTTSDRRWRTVSIQISEYGSTLGYGIVQVLAEPTGGIRKRVLRRGAVDVPAGVDVQRDFVAALRLVLEHLDR